MSLLAQLNVRSAPVNRPQKAALSDDLFQQLRSFIYDQTGIYFQDNKRYLLESRIGRRMQALNLPDYGAYLRHLNQPAGRAELPKLYDEITINETYFFRNTDQFSVLEQTLIPELAQERLKGTRRQVRIWSAACSTGDEPYTLALIIRERLQPRFPGIRFEIVGTDINTQVLDVARAGIYSAYAVRNVPPATLQRYFRQEGDRYHLDPEIRRMVTFKHLNLMDRSGMALMRHFDIILCANVLIYFDTASKQQVVSSLYASLNPGGFLMLGFSETLYGISQAFQPVRFEKTIAYKRGTSHA
ncbi:chemotaxis protein CheR [Rhodothermaceae bacterium RA]|nr:chemotaxis protein CheR [Rhodothermaceae bacterium RA]